MTRPLAKASLALARAGVRSGAPPWGGAIHGTRGRMKPRSEGYRDDPAPRPGGGRHPAHVQGHL